MTDDMQLIIRIARDHAGQLRDTVGSAIWELCDQLEHYDNLIMDLKMDLNENHNTLLKLFAAGDALATSYRTLGGLDVAHDTPLRAWEEARRG